MSATFSVKNFEKFQHYKDRSPPWIRLYNSLLDDYEFARLPDASKAHLLAIWLLASRYENKVPYDPEWVARRINATSPVDLNGLAEAGFIVADQCCSEALADCKQSALLETETEGETEETSLRSVSARVPRHDERKPSKTPSQKGTRLASDWQPSSDDAEYAKGKGVPADKLATLVEEFRNYWVSRPGKDGVKLDWSATFRNRVIQVCERNGWAPVANQGRAPPSVWVAADDPLWASVDARARMAGKPLVAIVSRHNGRGAYVPAEFVEPRAA